MKILCDAVSFGYGPVGKLLAIRPYLPFEWHFTLLASNTSHALATVSAFDEVKLCNTESYSELEAAKKLFLNADLFINIMNPVSAKYAAQIGIPTIEIDSLFWMWDEVPDYLLNVDTYYIQNFPGVRNQLQKYHPLNHKLVGPIIDSRFIGEKQNKNQLLIHLGGMRSKLVDPTSNLSYPHVIGKLLSTVLRSHEFDRVLICGDLQSLKSCEDSWTIPNSKYTILAHSDFLKELAESSALLTSPGLTTAFESFCYKTPAIFLPPQNASQFFILKSLREANAATLSLHWLDLYPDLDIPLGLPEDEMVKRVLRCISYFANDRKAQNRALDILFTFFPLLNLHNLVKHQTNFANLMGNSNGVLSIANDLKEKFN